jgi:2'-5' RNA ligase
MSQGSFFGMEPLSRPSEAVFLALRPGHATAAGLLGHGRHVATRGGFRGTFLLPDRQHVSLHPVSAPGFVSGNEDARALAALGQAVDRAGIEPFEVTVSSVMTFKGGPRGVPLVAIVDSPSMRACYRRLAEALAWDRFPFGRRQFEPHVTLAWGQGLIDEHPVVGLGWTAREIVLIRSHQGKGWHETLAKWPLRTPS